MGAKMKAVCMLALLVACVSAGPRPDKRDTEIAEFGVVDSITDAIKGKLMDVIKGQLTEENDGGDWADAVIDFLGDLVTQDVLDSVIDFIEDKIMGDQGTAVYELSDTALDALVKVLGGIMDILPDS